MTPAYDPARHVADMLDRIAATPGLEPAFVAGLPRPAPSNVVPFPKGEREERRS